MKPELQHVSLTPFAEGAHPCLRLDFDNDRHHISAPLFGTNDRIAWELEALALRLRRDLHLQDSPVADPPLSP